jgi:hypothetical protein
MIQLTEAGHELQGKIIIIRRPCPAITKAGKPCAQYCVQGGHACRAHSSNK